MKTTLPETLEAWLAACPLRKWLDLQPHGSRAKLALAVGVNVSLFGYWMRGDVMPRLVHLRSLQEATRITPQQWMKWYSRKPQNGVA